MPFEYDNREQWILAVLQRRGPEIERSKLLALLRHWGGAKELTEVLKGLQRRGLVEQYTESWQAQRRIEHRKMVRLLVDTELEALLA